MTRKRSHIGKSMRKAMRSARKYYLSSDSWVAHAVVLSLLIMVGWALVLADLSGILSLNGLLRAGFFYVITYGYVALLWLGSSLSVVVLAIEWHGIRALHYVDEEDLSTLEKKHPYLPSKRILFFILLLILSLPAFLFTAIRQSNAALALEEEPYIYEEARSWQIANDAPGDTFNDAASGNWNIGTTWGGACSSSCTPGTDYPNATNPVTIDSHTVTLTASHSGASMTITSAGTLNLAGNRLGIAGNWIQSSGTFTANDGTVILSGTGDTAAPNSLIANDALHNLTLNNGLVGYWKFDEGTGSTIAKDSSGNGNNGTLTNGPTWSANPTHASRFYNPYALSFDGTDDYVSVADNVSLKPTTAITLSVWTKVSSIDDLDTILAKGDTDRVPSQYAMQLRSTSKPSIYYVTTDTTNRFESTSATINPNEWAHVTFVYSFGDGSSAKLYINGVSVAGSWVAGSGNDAAQTGNHTLYFGADHDSAGQTRWINGLLDDVRIYNRALSASEVAALAAGNPSTGSGVYTLGSALSLSGELRVTSGELRTNNGENISAAGNWVNHGGFTSTGTVTLNAANGVTQTVSGSTVFKNFTKMVTAATTLFFDNTARQSFSGSLNLMGVQGGLLSLRSTKTGSSANLLLDGDSGTQNILYVNVKDSDASGGARLLGYIGGVNSGNNTNWQFTTNHVISGTVYTDEGVTAMGAGRRVSVSLNGGAAVGSGLTLANGTYSATMTGTTMTGGSILAVYIDNASEDAVTVTLGSGSNMAGVNLYQNRLIVRSDSGSSAITNAHLNIADNSADSDISAIYSVSAGNVVTMVTGKELMVWAGDTYTPGARIIVDDMDINGTLRMGTASGTVAGDWDATGGAFTSSGTVMFTGTGTITSNGSSFSGVTLNDGLVGYWPFDNGSGLSATDKSGYGNHGTMTGGPTWSSTVPTTSFSNPYALSFDGTDDYLIINDSASLSVGSTITVSAWVNTAVRANDGYTDGIVAKRDDMVGADGYLLGMYDSQWIWTVNGYTTAITSSTTFAINAWKHLTGVYDGLNIILYVNGVQAESKASTIINNTDRVLIGRFYADGSSLRHFNGLLDDVRIYNRALSATEVSSLAAGTQPATANATITLGSALDVNGQLIMNNGKLDVSTNNYPITVAKGWENNGGQFNPRGGTVTFDGTAGSHELQSGGQKFNAVTVNGVGGSWTLADRLMTNDQITMTNGTLDISANNYAIVTENWSHAGGTFTPRSGTVTLNGSATTPYSLQPTTFNNLSIEDPSETGLVGYWKFDEGQGLSAYDSSGNSNTGTLAGGPKWTAGGAAGIGFDNPHAMSFDGTDDYVNLTSAASILSPEDNNWSVSTWFKSSSTTDNITLFSLGNADGGSFTDWISLDINNVGVGDGDLRFQGDDGSDPLTSLATTSANYNNNAWHHIIVTRIALSNTWSLYVDGSFIQSDTNTDTSVDADVQANIGAWVSSATSNSFFNGLLDDVRIYNRALSAEEVGNLAAGNYANGSSGTATYTLGAALTVNGALKPISGTLNANGYAVNGGTLEMRKGYGTYLASTATQRFNRLTMSGGTFTGASGTVDINGNFTQSGGTFTAPSGTMTVSGSLVQRAGTFTHNSGTVTLDGTADSTQSSQLITQNPFHNLSINNGLVGYWKFDEGTGSTIAKDSSGNGNNGTLTNGPTWSANPTHASKFYNPYALSFDGTDDYVNVADSNTLDIIGDITITAWIKTKSYSNSPEIINKEANSFEVEMDSTGKVFLAKYGVAVMARSSSSVTNGIWYHITAKKNGTINSIYFDGVDVTNPASVNNQSFTANSNAIRIAAASSYFLNGTLDDVRIYNRALSASEVAALAAGNPSTGSGVYTLGSALSLSGELRVTSGELRTSNGENISVTGNWTNHGGFTSTGTVTLNAANGVTQTVSGSTVFKNFTKMVTAATTLFFDNTARQSFSGSLNLMGVQGGLLSLRSTKTGSAANLLLDGSSGTQNISYVNVKDSDASGGARLLGYIGGMNSGNNTNWQFTTNHVISGTVYTDEGVTAMGAGRRVSVSLNGGAAVGSGLTLANGTYSATMTGTTMTGGSILAVYIDNASEDAVTVTLGSGSNMAGVNLYQNRLIVRSDSGSTAITNAHLNIADNSADADISSIYSVSAGNVVTMVTGKELMVWAGDTYTPGAQINVDDMDINGTLRLGTSSGTVAGDWDATGGAFTSSGTVMFTGTGVITSNGSSFSGVTLNDGLVGYWPFDNGSGLSATDKSGYGNHGTLTGGPTWSSTVPTTSFSNPYSLSFDGTDDYVDTPDNGAANGTGVFHFNDTDNFTLSLWYKGTDTAQNGNYGKALLGREYGDFYASFVLRSGKVEYIHYNAGWQHNIISTNSVADGVWHHISYMNHTNETGDLYIDGVAQVTGASSTIDSSTYRFVVSSIMRGYSGVYTSGLLDDVRIYNRALSATEVSSFAAGAQPAAGVATITLGSALDVNGTLKIESGKLDVSTSNYGVTVARGWENDGGQFNARNGTVTLDGSASQASQILSGGQNFNDLSVTGAGSWTIADRLEMDGTLTQSNGTLDVSTSNYPIKAETINQTAGTFTARSGTITLDAATSQNLYLTSPVSHLSIEDSSETGLVGYWKFDEGQGLSAYDSSGNSNTGTLVNGPKWTASGATGVKFDNPYAMSFDGTDDHVSTVTINHNIGSGDFTWTVWIYAKSFLGGVNAYNAIMSNGTWSPGLYSYNGNLRLYWGSDRDSGFNLSLVTWQHITAMRQSSIVKYYVNGIQTPNTFSISDSVPNNVLAIGNSTSASPDEHWNGLLDDVRIYNRALSAEEVGNLAAGNYANGSSGTATYTLGAALTVNGALKPISGTLNANGYAVNGGTLEMRKGYGTYLASTATQRFNRLTMSGGTFTGAAGTVDINGNFTQSGGTFTAPSGTMTVSGSLVQRAGTFTHNSGTINLDGVADAAASSHLRVSSSLNNLTLNNGLVGYWKFDEGTGSTIAKDSSGNGNNGTLTNGPTWSANPTHASRFYNPYAIRFDGVNDYVNVPDSMTFTSGQPFTYTFWMKSTNNAPVFGWTLLLNNDNSPNANQGLFVQTAQKYLYLENASPSRSFTSVIAHDAQWHHISLVRNSSNVVSLYMDATPDLNTPTSTQTYKLIKINDNGNPFNGLLDDVRIYNRALSASEVAALAAGNPSTGSGVYTLGSALSLSGELRVTSGELRTNNGENISAAGNWVNHGGFTSTGTVTLNAANGVTQTVSGSTVFKNFTKMVTAATTLFFDNTARQSFSGSLNLMGVQGGLLSLRSTKTGSAANLLLDGSSGTQNISYVNVKDSDASGGLQLDAMPGGITGGNNTNWNIDDTAPNAPTIVSPVTGSATGSVTPFVTGTGSEASITLKVYSGATVLCTTTTAGTTPFGWSCNTTTRPEGVFILTAKETDGAGNESTASNSISLRVDKTAPTLAQVTPVTTPTNDQTPAYTFSVTDTGSITGGSALIIYGGSCSGSTVTPASGNNAISLAKSGGGNLNDRTYNDCTIRAQDQAGNASTSLSVTSFTVDTDNPDLQSFTSGTPDGTYRGGAEIEIVATYDETVATGSTITIILDTGRSVTLSTRQTATLSGTYTVQAGDISSDLTVSSITSESVLDAAGNTQTGTTLPVTNIADDSDIIINAYVTGTGTILGNVWNDEDGDGTKDDEEITGIGDITIDLAGTTATGATNIILDTTTSTGAYAFAGILRSSASGYTVTVSGSTIPAGYLRTTATSTGIVLGTGATITAHFGFVQASTLTGSVFFDTNANNVRDAGENSIFSGALLSLTGVTGTGETLTRSTLTNASGAYLFDQLPTSATSFVLVLTVPTGYEPTMSASRSITIATGGTLIMEYIGLVLPAIPPEEDEEENAGDTEQRGGRRGNGPPIIVQIPGPPAETPSGTVPAEAGQSPAEPTPEAPGQIADTPARDNVRQGVDLPPETPDNIYTPEGLPEEPAEPTEPSMFDRTGERIVNATHAAGSLLLKLLSDIQEAGIQTAQTIADIGNGTATVIANAVTGIGQGITTIASAVADTMGSGLGSMIAGIRGTTDAMDTAATSIAQTLVSAMESTGNAIASSVDALGNAVYESASSSALALRTLGVDTIADTIEFAGLLTNRALTVASVGIENLWQVGQDVVLLSIERRIHTTIRPAVIVAGALQDAIETLAVNTGTIARTMTDNINALGELAVLRASDRRALVGEQADQFAQAFWMDINGVMQRASKQTDLVGDQADHFRIAIWTGMDRSQRAARQIVQNLRPTPRVEETAEEMQHAAAPDRTYRTSLQPKDNRFLLASLHLSITDNWNVPLTNTPVVLFSIPKVAVTDEEGIATFHDVETGEHQLEIHLPSGAVEKRALIVEPPSGLQPEEVDVAFDVVLPVMQVKIDESLHASAETPAWLLPVVIIISLLALSNTVLLGLYMRRRRRE